MRASYNRIAGRFADAHGTMPPSVEAWAVRLLGELQPQPLVADVGCGPGGHARWFAGRGARVVALDLSDEMLRVARRDGVTHVALADMTRLPLRGDALDAIWCCASLLHVAPDLAPGVLASFSRALKPHGRLFLAMQEGTGTEWNDGRFGVERFFARYTPDELTALVRGAGFTVDDVHTEAPATPWMKLLATRPGPEGASVRP